MTSNQKQNRVRLGVALAALAMGLGPVAISTPAYAAAQSARPSETLNLSRGTGTLVRLSAPMSDLFVANDSVADVQVRSSTQLYVFGKSMGETTIYATDRNGRVVYASNVRVGNNLGSVGEMLNLAMPDADVQVTPMNNLVLLTGTVASPDDAAEALQLVKAYIGEGVQIVSRIKTATPLQVMLKVKIAEVNRSVTRQIGFNLMGRDPNPGGTFFAFNQGNAGDLGSGSAGGGRTFNFPSTGTGIGLAGKLFGLDLLGTLQLAENDGLVSTLAEPNLTAISGETANFLAGGEFPVPVGQGNSSISVEYKTFGVQLAFTPVVLADGRISLRVRPEVSELSNEGSIKLGGYDVPALTTRRAETTVELGSGQSFMIAGLLRNVNTNSVEKAPFLGDIPILGSLFRSKQYRRAETELVVIVTPYLVKPMSGRAPLPIDGYRTPSATDMMLEGKTYGNYPVASAPGTAPAPAQAAAGGAAPGFKM